MRWTQEAIKEWEAMIASKYPEAIKLFIEKVKSGNVDALLIEDDEARVMSMVYTSKPGDVVCVNEAAKSMYTTPPRIMRAIEKALEKIQDCV